MSLRDQAEVVICGAGLLVVAPSEAKPEGPQPTREQTGASWSCPRCGLEMRFTTVGSGGGPDDVLPPPSEAKPEGPRRGCRYCGEQNCDGIKHKSAEAKPGKDAMSPMTVGELKAAIQNYPDDSPVFLCDDQGYPKWTYGAYQVQPVCYADDKSEIYIEALSE